MSQVYLNGVQLTEQQADSFSEALHEWYENGRKVELKKEVAKHKKEIEQLPEIFQVRIDALKEVNPKRLSDSPELILSSLTAAFLVRTLKPSFKEITKEEYYDAHKKYGLDVGGDVNPYLVSELVFSYFEDIKNGAIDSNGKIIDIKKSKVMTTFHGWRENGIPMDAVNTVARFASKTTDTKKDKTVVLMNASAANEPEVCKLTVGTWSESQQQEFIKSLYNHVPPKGIGCLCSFDVEYDNTRLCDIGLGDGVSCTIDDWDDELKDANKGEFAIIMAPFIYKKTVTEDERLYCKCGATSPHHCPQKIKNGECTAMSIMGLVGSVLFPDKYFKQSDLLPDDYFKQR